MWLHQPSATSIIFSPLSAFILALRFHQTFFIPLRAWRACARVPVGCRDAVLDPGLFSSPSRTPRTRRLAIALAGLGFKRMVVDSRTQCPSRWAASDMSSPPQPPESESGAQGARELLPGSFRGSWRRSIISFLRPLPHPSQARRPRRDRHDGPAAGFPATHSKTRLPHRRASQEGERRANPRKGAGQSG